MSCSVLRFGEYVARASHCDDAPRLFWIVLDGRADARDVDINRAIERLNRLAFERIHQRFARHDPAGVLRECQEEHKLIAGKLTWRFVEPRRSRCAINFEPAIAQHVRTCPGCRSSSLSGAAPAQDRTQPRQSLAAGEWFG